MLQQFDPMVILGISRTPSTKLWSHKLWTKVLRQWSVVGTSMVVYLAVGLSAVSAQSNCPSGSGRARSALVPPNSAYVLSPLYGATILEQAPLLKWHPINVPQGVGNPTYTVKVNTMEGQLMWTTETPKTEVRYNADGKGLPLGAGKEYVLNITVNLPPQASQNSKYNEQELNQVSPFQTITPQNKFMLENSLAAVSPDLSPQQQAELKSELYAAYGVNGTALNLLEQAIAKGGSAAVLASLHYKAGSVYAGVGLWPLAQKHYEEAIDLATLSGKPELVAAFKLQLVESYSMLYSEVNSRKSIAILESLLPYYESKGDQFALEYIRGILDILRSIPSASK